jgi:hypothetical protein
MHPPAVHNFFALFLSKAAPSLSAGAKTFLLTVLHTAGMATDTIEQLGRNPHSKAGAQHLA